MTVRNIAIASDRDRETPLHSRADTYTPADTSRQEAAPALPERSAAFFAGRRLAGVENEARMKPGGTPARAKQEKW